MLIGRQTQGYRVRAERGASMVVALVATVAVLGFGAVVLQMVEADVRGVTARLEREEAVLHAEYALSEAVARVIDGQEATANGGGSVDGAAYTWEITNNGDESWTVVGRAGEDLSEQEVTTTLRRTFNSPPSSSPVQYALWADRVEGDGASGAFWGLVGASGWMDWDGSSVGVEQHLLTGATCSGCSNPVGVSSYTPVAAPVPVSSGSCPYSGGYSDKIKNDTIAAGHYSCGGSKLKLEGSISVTGPVVIHLESNTELDIKDASINVGGDPDDFWVVQATDPGSKWSGLEDSTLVGHLSMPQSQFWAYKSSWTGRIAVDYAYLYSDISGIWDRTGEPLQFSPDDGYALWADRLGGDGNVEDSLLGLVGASGWMDWDGSSVGVEQHLLTGATCSGCSNPVGVSSYTPVAAPVPVSSGSCPYSGGYSDKIKNDTIAAGHYSCGGSKLKLEGSISVTGPVVIHLESNTELDIKDASINVGGDPDDFWVVQATDPGSKWSGLEDSTLVGHLSMPQSQFWAEDASWTGRIEADYVWLYKDITVMPEFAPTPVTWNTDSGYALWADRVEGDGASGAFWGLVGASGWMDWDGSSVGVEQHLLTGATCSGCSNPVGVSSYTPVAAPVPVSSGSCPYSGGYSDKIKNDTIAAGHYSCGGSKLKLEGSISVTGPVVIHLESNTELDIKDASINVGGDPDDFWVVQATDPGSKWSGLEDSTLVGHLSMPQSQFWAYKSSWTGRIAVDYAYLYSDISGIWNENDTTSVGSDHTFGTSTYRAGSPDLDWVAAKAEAEAAGGILVEVDSAAENTFVVDTFGDGFRPIWLGFDDTVTEGLWVGADGTPMSYTNWWPGQPKFGNGQHYARIGSVSGLWMDSFQWSRRFLRGEFEDELVEIGRITVIEFEHTAGGGTWTLDSWDVD